MSWASAPPGLACETSADTGLSADARRPTRVLRQFSFVFQPIGPRQDYYGPVRPYFGDLRRLERELAASNPDMLAWFQAPL